MDLASAEFAIGYYTEVDIGGVCGEICVDTSKGCSLLLVSPLAASQNFVRRGAGDRCGYSKSVLHSYISHLSPCVSSV